MKYKVGILLALLGVAFWGLQAANNPNIVNLDLDIDGISDTPDANGIEPEKNPGGFVCVGGRKKIILTCAWLQDDAKMRLSWDSARIVIEDASGTEVAAPIGSYGNGVKYKDYPASESGKELYVKGTLVSAAAMDVAVTLEALHNETVPLPDTVRFTVMKVDSIEVRPYQDGEYGSTASIVVGGKATSTHIHEADVKFVVAPPLPSGATVAFSVELSGAQGDPDDKVEAVLMLAGVTMSGNGPNDVVFDSATVVGTLRSSNLTRDCTVASGSASATVLFEWADETLWESSEEFIVIDSVSDETLTLTFASDGIDEHKIKFYVEEVEYINDDGDIEVLYNTITSPNPTAVATYAYFTQNPQVTDEYGQVTTKLHIPATCPENICSILMVAYDLSANAE